MSAYLNIYRVLSAAVLWGMENNHGIRVHFIILNLPITIRVKQFWWDNVTVLRRWSFKGDGGRGALMADTGFHFYHDHLLEFWWLSEVLNTTRERKSREKPRTVARTWCCDWRAGTRDEGMEEERGMKGRGHPNRRDKGMAGAEGWGIQWHSKKFWISLVIQWPRIHCHCRGHRVDLWSGKVPRGNSASILQLLSFWAWNQGTAPRMPTTVRTTLRNKE